MGGGGIRVYDTRTPFSLPGNALSGYWFHSDSSQSDYGVGISSDGNLAFLSIFYSSNGPESLRIIDATPSLPGYTTATTGSTGTTATTGTTGITATTGTTGIFTCPPRTDLEFCLITQWYEPAGYNLFGSASYMNSPHLLAVNGQAGNGYILDISNPNSPTVRHNYPATSNARTPVIVKNDRLMFVPGDNVRVFNITEEMAPFLLSSFGGPSSQVVIADSNGRYVVAGYNQGFGIYDLNLVINPITLSTVDYGQYNFVWGLAATSDFNTLFVIGSYLYRYDISNKVSPVLTATWSGQYFGEYSFFFFFTFLLFFRTPKERTHK
jgi:hypothetical protein